MAFLNIDKIILDGNLLTAISNHIKNFLNQPSWLKTFLIIAVLFAGVYFTYSYFRRNSDILQLQSEVIEINKKFNGILDEDCYYDNLIYIITEIQLLQQEENQNYADDVLELELMQAFIQRHHPGDPIIQDFEAMKSRLKVNHDSYMQHYQRVMEQLIKTANSKPDSISEKTANL